MPAFRDACNGYKADVVRQVHCGRRLSMSSSVIDSCGWVNATLPLAAYGQMNRPRSNRLDSRHRPSPIHYSTLTMTSGLPLNRDTWPLYKSSASAAYTCVARWFMWARMSDTSADSQILVFVGRPINLFCLLQAEAKLIQKFIFVRINLGFYLLESWQFYEPNLLQSSQNL